MPEGLRGPRRPKAQKNPVAIIQKYRNGLTEQVISQDEVNCMISVDIARRDLKSANTGNNLKGLLPGCRELKLNPVLSMRGIALASLNTGEIRTEVTVEIRNCKWQPRSNRLVRY